MALIAVDAVVDIPVHIVVVEVARVVVSVAARALKDRVVVRVDVAGRADVIRVTVAGREGRVLRVIEGSAGPT